jgi:PAS domain S-box-containing protein
MKNIDENRPETASREVGAGDYPPGPSAEPALEQSASEMRESLERFQLALHGSHDGIWDARVRPGQSWDSPQTEMYYSPRFKELLGFREDEMSNLLGNWSSRLHPDDREAVFRAVREHLEHRRPFDIEYRLQTKSGEYRWFSARGKAVWNSQGEPMRMAGSLRDITQRRRAEETLRLRDRALAASTCGIVIVDALQRDYPIVYVNPSFERIFGYASRDVLGRNPRFLQWGDRDQPVLGPLREAIHQGQPYRAVLRNYRKDGTRVWNELILAPVHDEQHRLTHFVGIQNDISEREALERKLAQADKMSDVGQLAAGLAHELNTPLHAILGFAQSLLREGSQAQPLQFIEKEAQRCQKLVQSLLTFSRQRRNELTPESPVDLWESVLPLIENQAKLKHVVVKKEFEAGLPEIKMDHSQVLQTLINLCTNAFDAMPEGGTLTVGAARKFSGVWGENSGVVFSVADTGQGIDPQIRDKIFEPFFTTKEVGKGTGLGLSLAYEMAQRHRGAITVSSEVGKGSLFEVFLPVSGNTGDDQKDISGV